MTCNIILNFKGLWIFVSVHRLNYQAFNDLDSHTHGWVYAWIYAYNKRY